MRSISEFSIKKPATAFMIILSMVVFGILGMRKMPIELRPNTDYPIIRIRVKWDGATPSDVEKMLTRKIEDILPNIDGIKNFSSTSEAEKSTIEIEFDYGVDIDNKITLVQNEINQIRNRLPEDIDEPIVRERGGSSAPAANLVMFGGDTMEMRTYAENVLSPMLEKIDGVSEVIVFGGAAQQVLVEVDPEKLENYNLNINEVIQKIKNSHINVPSGKIREGYKEYIVKVQGEIETAEEVGDVILVNRDGHLLRVKEIANVRMDKKDRDSIYRKEGREGIGIIVRKTDSGNTIAIVDEIKKAIKNIEKSLPLNSNIIFEFDSSVTIINSILNVKNTAILGLILAAGVLFVFLKNISSTIIISTAIPVSIIFTFFLLNAQGLSLNMVSLMGLSLGIGMLVDNSVVVVDNIFRHMSELDENRSIASQLGAEEVGMPILSSTLTTVSVFFPLVFQEGISKQQFQDMSYAITYSLMASLVVALVFVPMISSKIMSYKNTISTEGKIFKFTKEKYVEFLSLALKNKGKVIITTLILFVGSMFVARTIGGKFNPTTDIGRFAVVALLPNGADVNMTNKVGKILEERTRELKNLQTYTVSGNTESVALNMNMGLKTSRDESMGEILRELRKRFSNIPDVNIAVVPNFTYGTRGIYDLEFELYSDNMLLLEEVIKDLEKKIRNIDGIAEFKTSLEGGKPEARIVVDREKAAYYNLDIQTIAKTIQAQILGGVPFKIYSDNSEVDVTVQLEKKYRESNKLLMDSRITLPNGKNIKISDIAKLEIIEGPAKIEKENKKMKVILYANLDDEDKLMETNEKIIKIFEEGNYPDSVTFGFGGKTSNMKDMLSELSYVFGIGLFLIYFILVWEFESFILPFIILLSVPLSTTGAFYSLKLAGKTMDSMVAVGFVMLAGIVVNNAIVLIDFIKGERENKVPLNEAVIKAGRTRLRPILMTTLTTILGMIPLALSNGESSELYNGMAFVVIFGLSSATVLTLIVIPIIYCLTEDLRKILRKATERYGGAIFDWRNFRNH